MQNKATYKYTFTLILCLIIINCIIVVVYVERLFRLRGNLLFYFKTKEVVRIDVAIHRVLLHTYVTQAYFGECHFKALVKNVIHICGTSIV